MKPEVLLEQCSSCEMVYKYSIFKKVGLKTIKYVM